MRFMLDRVRAVINEFPCLTSARQALPHEEGDDEDRDTGRAAQLGHGGVTKTATAVVGSDAEPGRRSFRARPARAGPARCWCRGKPTIVRSWSGRHVRAGLTRALAGSGSRR